MNMPVGSSWFEEFVDGHHAVSRVREPAFGT